MVQVFNQTDEDRKSIIMTYPIFALSYCSTRMVNKMTMIKQERQPRACKEAVMADQAGVMNSNDRKMEQDDFHRIKSFPEKVSGKEPGGRRQKGGTSRKNCGKRRNKAAERRGNGIMGCV